MHKQTIDISEELEAKTYANLFFGLGVTNKINAIIAGLKSRGINDLFVVTGPEASEAWPIVADALDKNGITWTLHHQEILNPTIKQTDIAAALEHAASSATGKHTAVLLKHLDKGINSLYELKFFCTPETS